MLGNVSDKLNSDDHPTEIMDILLCEASLHNLQWPCVYLAVYISDTLRVPGVN